MGWLNTLPNMGNKYNIKTIYTEGEGATSKETIQKYLMNENIEHHRTRAHPNFSERAIRSLNDEKKGRNMQWPDHIF